MSDDKPAAHEQAPKPANEPGPTPYVVAPGNPHLERSMAPAPIQPTKGKRVVATSGDTYLHVGNHRIGPEGIEVGPKQLDDIRDAAAANGIHLHVIGEEN